MLIIMTMQVIYRSQSKKNENVLITFSFNAYMTTSFHTLQMLVLQQFDKTLSI